MVLVVVLLALGLAPARAEYWETDPAFTAVLESSTRPRSVQLLATPSGKLIVSQDPVTTYLNGVLRPSGLTRLNADGSVDDSFVLAPDGIHWPLVAYADGRVLVWHTRTEGTTAASTLVRLRPDGSSDATFHSPIFDPGTIAISAQLQAGDRILLTGNFLTVDGLRQTRLCVLNADGTVSSSFTSPFQETSLAGEWEHFSVTVLADGRFMVAGSFVNLGAANLHGLARLLADGTVDPTLNANAVPFPDHADPQRVYPQSDGRMLVSYANTSILGPGLPRGILRVNADGSHDPSFHSAVLGEQVIFGPQQSDGKIIYHAYDGPAPGVKRLNPDGTIDSSFALITEVSVTMPVLAADGTFYFASPLTHARAAADHWITHVLADGTIDAAYQPVVRAQARITAFARQPDGKLVIAGDVDHVNGTQVSNGFVRLNADGSLDPTFAPAQNGSSVVSLVVQPAGKVLATFAPGGEAGPLRRFNADGSLDAGFPLATGEVQVDAAGRIYRLHALTATTTMYRLDRFDPDGNPDPTYTPVVVPSNTDDSDGRGVFAVAPEGAVFAVARAPSIPEDPVLTVYRYKPDGLQDAGFEIREIALPDIMRALVPLPDGGVVVIGSRRGSPIPYTLSFVRYDQNGRGEYRYEGGDVWPTDRFHTREVGGVLYDALRAVGAPAETRVRADIPHSHFPVAVEVSANGRLTALDHNAGYQTLVQLQRTEPTSPSVDPVPKVLASTNSASGALSVGGRATLAVTAGGLLPVTYQWSKNGVPIVGATEASYTVAATGPADAGDYTVTITNAHGAVTSAPIALAVTTTPAAPAFLGEYAPSNLSFLPGQLSTLYGIGSGNPLPALTWYHDGLADTVHPVTLTPSHDRVTSALTIPGGLSDTGLYHVTATNDTGVRSSPTVIVGPKLGLLGLKLFGDAQEIGPDIRHPNGNTYDQLLLRGRVASITADPGQVSRISFVDLNDDIVQVEFSGAGTLTVVLTGESGPAVASRYNQPDVAYMKGHAAIVITDADETTDVTILSVGSLTAVNQGLFKPTTEYDGVADIAYLAILSRNTFFGSVRAGNVSFFGTRGFTGIHAPEVAFVGSVFVGDIDAHDDATPVLTLGSSFDTAITGGNLEQANGRAVIVTGGVRSVRFVAGTTSHNVLLPAQHNRARLVHDGEDVTDRIVSNPSP